MINPLSLLTAQCVRIEDWSMLAETLGLLSKEAQTALFDLKQKTRSFWHKPKSQDLRAGRSQNHYVPTHRKNLQIASKILKSSSVNPHICQTEIHWRCLYYGWANLANLFPSSLSPTLNLIRTIDSSLAGSKGMHTHTKVNKNTRVCSSLEEISCSISAKSSSHWDSNLAWWSLSGKPNLQRINNSRHYLLISSRYNSSISRDKRLQMIKQQHQCNKVRPMVVADTRPSMDRLSRTITAIRAKPKTQKVWASDLLVLYKC